MRNGVFSNRLTGISPGCVTTKANKWKPPGVRVKADHVIGWPKFHEFHKSGAPPSLSTALPNLRLRGVTGVSYLYNPQEDFPPPHPLTALGLEKLK